MPRVSVIGLRFSSDSLRKWQVAKRDALINRLKTDLAKARILGKVKEHAGSQIAAGEEVYTVLG